MFDLKPLAYHSDGSKITFVIKRLSGRAAQWASVILENWTPASSSFPGFTAELRRVFDHLVQSGEAASLVFDLQPLTYPGLLGLVHHHSQIDWWTGDW